MYEKVTVMVSGKPASVLIDKSTQPDDLPHPPCFVVGLSSHYHDKFSKEFRSFYKLVLIDLYWTDPRFPAAYIDKLEMATLSDHLEQVRTQLEQQLGDQYRQVFMLGHSAYGLLCIDYALRYPEKLLGVMNIASPLVFDNELITKWQEEYIDANFGNPKIGGPTTRWHDYYQKKAEFSKQPPEPTKKYFVDSYASKAPLFFNSPALSENKQDQIQHMWKPWQIAVFDKETKTVNLETRDINMVMMFRYIQLVTNTNAYDKLPKVQTPILWVIPLVDSGISLYHLEDKRMPAKLKNVEFFHPADTSHWPMLPQDNDTRAFDSKAITWGTKIIESCCHDKPSIMSKL